VHVCVQACMREHVCACVYACACACVRVVGYDAVSYNVLLCVTACCSLLHCILRNKGLDKLVCCSALQYVAVRCSLLKFVVVCCRVLQ